MVLISVVGCIAYFTSGLTSDFKTFYVENEGEKILNSSNGLKMTKSQPMDIDVKYTFSPINKKVSGYSVKVVPNVVEGKDFDIILDGLPYSFQAESDMTKGFDIVQNKDSFTIKPKGDINEILQAVYPNITIMIIAKMFMKICLV